MAASARPFKDCWLPSYEEYWETSQPTMLVAAGYHKPLTVSHFGDRKCISHDRLKTPPDHVKIFARRNGFACLYNVQFDQQRLRFSASLKVGDRILPGIANSKRTAKQEAALSFLRFLCSGGVQANWDLPEDAAECGAYLNRMSETLEPHSSEGGVSSTSDGESQMVEAPRAGLLMELKTLGHMRRVKRQLCSTKESSGQFLAAVKLGSGQKFKATGISQRKANPVVSFLAVNCMKGIPVNN